MGQEVGAAVPGGDLKSSIKTTNCHSESGSHTFIGTRPDKDANVKLSDGCEAGITTM